MEKISFGKRLAANIIDLFLAYLFLLIYSIILGVGFGVEDGGSIFAITYVSIFVLIFLFVGLSWHATPGKRMLGIKIVSEDGGSIDTSKALFISALLTAQFVLIAPFSPDLLPHLKYILPIGIVVFVIANFSALFLRNGKAVQDYILNTNITLNKEKYIKVNGKYKRDWRVIKESDFGLSQLSDGRWEWMPGFNGRLALWIKCRYSRNVQKLTISNKFKDEVWQFYQGILWGADQW